jgi:3-oxoacyl-[acyl-carrier protein] reductase
MKTSHHRVAVVTGAAAGIGEAIARALAADGLQVVAVDRDGDGAARLAAAIEQAGGRALSLEADLADAAHAAAVIEEAVRLAGRLDVLVNNAGIGGVHDFLDYPLALWQQVLAINLTAPLVCAQAAVPHMARQGRGRILNVASISAFCGNGGRAAYTSTKAGLVALTRQMAVEFGPLGITANAIAPGMTLTPLVATLPGAVAQWNERAPIGRPADPAEIGAVASFLASDDAGYVNGHALVVDGGFLATGLMDGGRTAPEGAAR